MTEDTVLQDISDQLDRMAYVMRIGRQAAQRYVTDEVIADHAARIAYVVDEHRTAEAGVVNLAEEPRRRRQTLALVVRPDLLEL
ncbi:hypothetical protein [Mycolicibacterium nivoides]|uniref:hypothetical protein n=1 Tax=Mycolicibacterium nivoides TaxID=2487344 RepID=UPI003C2B105B